LILLVAGAGFRNYSPASLACAGDKRSHLPACFGSIGSQMDRWWRLAAKNQAVIYLTNSSRLFSQNGTSGFWAFAFQDK
jgi:hypothetical protein